MVGSMSSFPLRFTNAATRHRLRVVADQLGTSMNRLAEEIIERELAALSLGLESELEDTIRRLRELRQVDVDQSLLDWAEAEGQADPISARMRVAHEDPFGIAAAFGR
jgi:hypothetical protein